MTGFIEIGGRIVELTATFGTMLRYKQQFGIEYNDDIQRLHDLKENDDEYITQTALVGIRLMWAMAKTADDRTPPPEIWAQIFDKTDVMPLMIKAVALFNASVGDTQNNEEPEDNDREEDDFSTEELAAICIQCGISVVDLDRLTVGMVMKILSSIADLRKPEKETSSNIRKATPADIERFFG